MNVCIFPVAWFSGLPAATRTHVNIASSTAALLLIAPFLMRIPHVCLMRYLLHLPCPGCGITTGLLFILKGDFRSALHANPAALGIATFLLFQTLGRPLSLISNPRGVNLLGLAGRAVEKATLFSLLFVWVFRLLF